MYLIRFGKQAEKDKKLLKGAGLDKKAKELLNIVSVNPFQNPPPYEGLVGNLAGFYSRRINLQHRLVYEVFNEPVEEAGIVYEGTVRVVRMWNVYTTYGKARG
ncbi:MAG: Txe/YoeB family addiction module toxin [Lachnospiraceae bacterium]|nr:Txe/YoeB family addiction module toxin [Lachnospiraceae bacterium]